MHVHGPSSIAGRNPAVLGLAPLTSMFWHGKNTNVETDDFRPEVHDSDGLMLSTGAGRVDLAAAHQSRRDARHVVLRTRIRAASGCSSASARFEDYQDLEADYHLRPSAWVEPVGDWGRGSVRLVELHAPDETDDNIVAFWVPGELPPAGHADRARVQAALVHGPDPSARRLRRSPPGTAARGPSRPTCERFVVDFDGAGAATGAGRGCRRSSRSSTAATGATLVHTAVREEPVQRHLAGGLRPPARRHGPAGGAALLPAPGPDVLTETWSYLWQP